MSPFSSRFLFFAHATELHQAITALLSMKHEYFQGTDVTRLNRGSDVERRYSSCDLGSSIPSSWKPLGSPLVKLLDSSKPLSLSAEGVWGFSLVYLLPRTHQYLWNNETPSHFGSCTLPKRAKRGQQIGRQAQMIPVPQCTVVHSWASENDG